MKKKQKFNPLEITLFFFGLIAVICVAQSLLIVSKTTQRHLPMIRKTNGLLKNINQAHLAFEETIIDGITPDKKEKIKNHIDQALEFNHILFYGGNSDIKRVP